MMQPEYDAEMKKNVIRVYCDRCRGEILMPYLGHQDVFGCDDICCTCYSKEYEKNSTHSPNLVLL